MESILLEEEDVVVFEEGHEANDLSCWELVNPSDADSDTESLHSLENGFVSWYSLTTTSSPPKSPKTDPETQAQNTLQDQDFVNLGNSRDDHQCDYHHYDVGPIIFSDVVDQYRGDEDEDEDDEEDDGYGLDDELVPWHVTGKLGRQRMRKLGKRVFAKMSNSKRNPYLHVKPGCVHGKHGLGIKA